MLSSVLNLIGITSQGWTQPQVELGPKCVSVTGASGSSSFEHRNTTFIFWVPFHTSVTTKLPNRMCWLGAMKTCCPHLVEVANNSAFSMIQSFDPFLYDLWITHIYEYSSYPSLLSTAMLPKIHAASIPTRWPFCTLCNMVWASRDTWRCGLTEKNRNWFRFFVSLKTSGLIAGARHNSLSIFFLKISTFSLSRTVK